MTPQASAAITVRVLTHEGLALEDEAISLVAPGEPGYLGILRHHASLVTTLRPGMLSWTRPDGERRKARLGSGLLEVVKNHVTILTDAVSAQRAEPPEGTDR
ncbi:MAG: F0F1 ATP synthase subunit epsilon [Candidatus Omnitrophica bacterium]|nr:F0F1 ATP synthase subunit epsilon [Candidatus Omnitrophota bacterium]